MNLSQFHLSLSLTAYNTKIHLNVILPSPSRFLKCPYFIKIFDTFLVSLFELLNLERRPYLMNYDMKKGIYFMLSSFDGEV
jgi:hypothetical protein